MRAGDVIVAVDGTSLKGALAATTSVARIKGRVGTDGDAAPCAARTASERDVTLAARRDPGAIVASQGADASTGARSPSIRLADFASGAHARRPSARAQGAARTGPTASSSTCAATAAAWSTRPSSWPASSSPTARSSRPRAARCRRARSSATGDPIAPKHAARRARRPRHGVSAVGDRHRRAAGPRARRGRRHAHVRQGRLPGGHRALQRRRARHHRRPVLHAQGAQPRRPRDGDGHGPDARRQGRRTTPKTEGRRGAATRRCRRSPARPPDASGRQSGDDAPSSASLGQARALPRRRAVLRARPPRGRRPGPHARAGQLVRPRGRPRRSSRRAAARRVTGHGEGRARSSGARTSRATCSRR